MPMITERERYRGCLLGLACGDAVGTTVEFRERGSFAPLTDMVGGGPFGLPPGAWTDDCSMALCLGHSLVYRGGFDPVDQMNRYCNWQDYGYMSSTGSCFDIGMTVRAALDRYRGVRQSISGELLLQGGFMLWTTKNPSGLGLEGFGAGRRRGSDAIIRCGRPSEPTPQAWAYPPYSLGISMYFLDAPIAPPDGGRD